MNKRIKRLWVKALRSGKYKQGDQELRNTDQGTYCCLGVLADLYRKEKKKAWDNSELAHEDFNVASDRVADWAGIDRAFDEDGNPGTAQKKLADFNDDGKSFKWIASYIERYL